MIIYIDHTAAPEPTTCIPSPAPTIPAVMIQR